jgi:hypothetical protein
MPLTTREAVANLVKQQIGDQWDRTNLHHVDLRHALVEPTEVTLVDAHGNRLRAWVVLREDPSGGPCYGIAYDPLQEKFGLVQFAPNFDPFFIGYYGGFFDAFEAM